MSYPIVERPNQPGLMCCLVSGTSELGRYVELGFSAHVDHLVGCVYLSEAVAGRIATAIGWVPVDEAAALRDELATARAECDQLRGQLSQAAVDAASVARADLIVTSFGTMIAAVEERITDDEPDDPEPVAVTAIADWGAAA